MKKITLDFNVVFKQTKCCIQAKNVFYSRLKKLQSNWLVVQLQTIFLRKRVFVFYTGFLVVVTPVHALCPNLIPNGGFEGPPQVGVQFPAPWIKACQSPDLNTNNQAIRSESNPFGTTTAGEGTQWLSAHNGQLNGEGESEMVQLTQPLQVGVQYQISYLASTTNRFLNGKGRGHVHVSLSQTPLLSAPNCHTGVSVVDQEVTGKLRRWARFTHTFTATEPFQYIEFGAGTPDTESVSIDDVSLRPVQCRPPVCTGFADNVFLSPSVPFSTQFQGIDPDGDNLTFTGSWSPSMPIGATFTPNSGSTGTSPLFVDLDWTPTIADLGANYCATVNFTDTFGLSDYCQICMPVGQCSPAPPGMVGWWPFDEASGVLVEDVAHIVNDGTMVNGAQRVAGVAGKAMQLDGVDDHVFVPHISNSALAQTGQGDMSIDAWISVSGTGVLQPILDKRQFGTTRGYAVCLFDGKLGFLMSDPSEAGFVKFISASPDLRDGQLHHIAITLDRDQTNGLRFFLDGTLVNVADPTDVSGTLVNSQELRFGRSHVSSGAESFFSGTLDEIEIFDRVISPSAIKSIFDSGNFGKCRQGCQITASNHPLAFGSTTSDTDIQICNYSQSEQDYLFELEQITSLDDPSCNATGPSSFSPDEAEITLPAGACTILEVAVTSPDIGKNCFSAVLSNYQDPLPDYIPISTCSGSAFHANNSGGDVFDAGTFEKISVTPFGTSTPIDFTIGNNGASVYALNYIIEVRTTDATLPIDYFTLDGQSIGVPVTGSILIPSGGSAVLQVDLEFLRHEPYAFFELVLLTDLDQDGQQDDVLIARQIQSTPIDPSNQASISGVVFDDLNANGTQDIGEPLQEGLQINLTGAVNMVVYTDANGIYSFNGLLPGDYKVTYAAQVFVSASLPSSGEYNLTLAPNEAALGNDFGSFEPTFIGNILMSIPLLTEGGFLALMILLLAVVYKNRVNIISRR